MKRAPIVLLGTVAGVAGVLMLNPQGSSFTAQSTTDPSTGTGTTTDTSATGTGSTTGTGTTTSNTTSSSSSGVSGTATGDAVFVNYGNVQLKVTVKNNKITKIVAVQLPNQDGRSIEIANASEPMLREQALKAQSANIAGVSGATFTSYGYQQSLQSALDKLGFK